MKLRKINSVVIQNVRGIGNQTFPINATPNKVALLVAPNGFGKTSFATAFSSLNRSRIALAKEDAHKEDLGLLPSLALEVTKDDSTLETLVADSTSNRLSAALDVFVANSKLIPVAKRLKISGATIAMASLEVEPVVLIEKIPAKKEFQYNLSDLRLKFLRNGKVLTSIRALFGDPSFGASLDAVSFSKAGAARATSAVNSFVSAIDATVGSIADVLAAVPMAVTDQVLALPHIQSISELEGIASEPDRVQRALLALQVFWVFESDKDAFRSAIAWSRFCRERADYEAGFKMLRATWKGIRPSVDKKAGLVVRFPKANRISNGERDVICFSAQLMRARMKLRSDVSLLIVDELFDYLDDANLAAAQFYMSEMIAEFKANGRQLFPLVLTHLNPGYFKKYCFKKYSTTFLSASGVSGDRTVERVIIKRDDLSIKAGVAEKFLHYHPANQTLSAEFAALGLSASVDSAFKFSSHVFANLAKYLADQKYDPVAVCCAVRLMIEKWVYECLDVVDRPNFLTTFKTTEKLEFADDRGVDVPDVFFILAPIYNEALHLKENHESFAPLASKLENLTIKHMVRVAEKLCIPP